MTVWEWEGGAVVLRFVSLNVVCGTIIGGVNQINTIIYVWSYVQAHLQGIHMFLVVTLKAIKCQYCGSDSVFQTLCFRLYLGFRLYVSFSWAWCDLIPETFKGGELVYT